MIGTVEWDHHIDGIDEPIRVVMALGDDLVFRSEQMPRYAEALTESCLEEHRRWGPALGYFGPPQLRRLAESHGGVATIDPSYMGATGLEPDPPGLDM